MRFSSKMLSLSAIFLGAQLGAAMAQTDTGIRPGHAPGEGPSYPMAPQDSNVMPGDTHSVIAPTPPPSAAGPDGSVQAQLIAANQAIAAHQSGTADEALENAETQILTRAVPQTQADQTSSNPVVGQIEQARTALGKHDKAGATQIINQILASNAPELAD